MARGVTHKELDMTEAAEHSIIAVTHLASIGMLWFMCDFSINLLKKSCANGDQNTQATQN